MGVIKPSIVGAGGPQSADATVVPRPLRVGLLLDSLAPAAWVEHVLKRIVAEGIADLTVVILNAAAHGSLHVSQPGLRRRIATWYRNRDALAYSLYARLDARRYGTENDPAKSVDLSEMLRNVPVVRIQPRMTRFCDYFDDADVAQILTYDLDVALRFGFRILKGDSLRIARDGVWSFHHGDNSVNRGGPAGFWEVMEHHEVTGAVLQRLTEALDGGDIVGRSFASTNRFSPTANRANYYWQATDVLVAQLRVLADRLNVGVPGPDSSGIAEPEMLWSSYSNRLYRTPSTIELISGVGQLVAKLTLSKIRSVFMSEQWLIAYRLTSDSGPTGDVPDGVFYRFNEMVPPRDRFWADPFPIHTDGKHFIFFEEHILAEPNAHINVVEIGPAGVVGAPRIVLQRPYHLSYPSVFEWNGEWYMTPETASRRAVELFRAVSFPDKWEFVGPLLSDVDAVDPTIACINGRWWMFVAIGVRGTTEAAALHIYSASTPIGPWTPHRRNPVKIDVRGARPGGRVFIAGGRYYRVAQDGAPSYGSGLRVFIIDHLDDNAFRETEVSRIIPRWRPGLVGVHTLNASGGLTVVDARQVRRWPS